MDDRSARGDALIGVLMLLVVALFGPATSDIYIDPFDAGLSAQGFPIGVLVLIAALALVLLARSIAILSRAGGSVVDSSGFHTFAVYVLPMVAVGFAYIWLIGLLQYAVPTALAAAGSLALFGNRGFGRLVAAPMIGTAVYYVLFFGVLGLHETPGDLLSFDSQAFFQPLRIFLGLQ